MRYVKNIFDIVNSGELVGSNRPHGRVTIQPDWHIQKTPPAFGSSIRGPYRWFHQQYKGQGEYEIPNIKSININRSKGQDLATCTITMYNQYHNFNTEQLELEGQLGKPGYFWYDRGKSQQSTSRWRHTEAFGAYDYEGVWHNDFSWKNVLVPHGLIRTYQGYGGYNEFGGPVPIADAVDGENILITGTWLVDTISAGDDGLITINCRDVGRLLLDQFCFPPIVPDGIYPVEYYPPGKSAFDSPWGPKANIGDVASRGEVRLKYSASSLDIAKNSTNYSYNVSEKYENEVISTGRASHSVDGNWKTYSLSEGFANFDDPDALVWFEFDVNQTLDSISLKCWAGGYECYVSVKVNNQWVGAVLQDGKWVQGTNAIPYGGNLSNTSIPYIKKINIPASIPNNMEPVINIDFPSIWPHPIEVMTRKTNQNLVQKLRISFKKLYYSSVSDSGNKHYRAGIRDLVGTRVGDPTAQFSGNFDELKWTYSMTSHPTRGYWIIDGDGTVSGFGDAADYDSTAFGDIPIDKFYVDNYPNAITAHPDGKGYWVLDRMGHVYPQGSAVDYGEVLVEVPPPSPYLTPDGQVVNGMVLGFSKVAMDIAATHTGNGYWVIYSDGTLRGFGDAFPTYGTVPMTAMGNMMYSKYANDGDLHPGNIFYTNGGGWNQKRGTAISAHPNKMGCWVVNGHGEVFTFGDVEHYGQLNGRVYNKGTAQEFSLGDREWGKNIESTATGEGYWIAFGGGRIAAFGDAIEAGGTQDIWLEYRKSVRLGVDISEDEIIKMQDFAFFRALLWDIARDPDGGKNSKGFWALLADGSVGSYDAEAWGRPGYFGLSGYRWHDGNYEDYADIVKEFLMWAGFLYKDESITSNDKPGVLGNIEFTGVKTDTVLPQTMFDKKSIIDIIKQLAEVTAYLFYIQEDGSVRFEAPNWWSPGNYNEYGEKIYVDSEGNIVDKGDPITQPNLPQEFKRNAPWTLYPGESVSCNNSTLTMQTDGNLVLTAGIPIIGPGTDRGIVWESGTDGYPGSMAKFKADGSFVITSSDGVSEIWTANSGSGNFSKAYVVLAPTQELAIYALSTGGAGPASVVNIWSSGTALDMTIDAPSFVPVIDEEIDMMNYNVTLNWDSMRSEFIVGAEGPNPANPSAINYTRYKPPASYMEVFDDVPALRGIERPGMWINTNFTNKEETRLMLELLSLHAFFAQRTGSITCIANPCLSLNDQIKIFERTTSETFVHYIQSINTTMDLDTGVYTSSISTHWLGDESDWVIRTSSDAGSYIDRFRISERLDRWQRETNRELVGTGEVLPTISLNTKISGSFNSRTIQGI